MIHRNMEDKRMRATIKNKSDVPLHGLKPGGELRIETDRQGTPLSKEWRRRLVDAKIDKSVVITKWDKELTGALKSDAEAKVATDKAAKIAKSAKSGGD